MGLRLMRSTSGLGFDDLSSSGSEQEGDRGERMFHGMWRGMSLRGREDRKVGRELGEKMSAGVEGWKNVAVDKDQWQGLGWGIR